MKRPLTPTHALITLALAGLILPGCTGPTATMSLTPKEGVIRRVPVKTAPAGLAPLPRAAAKAFTATTAGGTLTGTVKLEKIDEPYFQNSAAPYLVQAVPTNLGNAMITLTTLQEEIYTKDGKVIDGLTGLDSAFTLTGLAPKDKPYVVNAGFVQSHRLSGFAFPDGTGNATATVNEASTMVVEMARWQLSEILASHAAAIATLYTNTTALLGLGTPTALTSDGGTIPNVTALKHGAGHEMRNAYVAAFGALVEPAGDANAIGNKLSDTWKALLGYRPLALTRAIGNGARGFNQGDGKPATETPMGGPIDAVLDHNGNMWVTEQDGGRIRFVPKNAHGALLGWGAAMSAGNIYTLMGNSNGPGNLDDYNYGYEVEEADGIANTEAAPLVTSDTVLYAPRRLVLKPAATSGSHLFFTSKFAHRVYFVPAGNPGSDAADPTPVTGTPADFVEMFGKRYYAGRLYTLVGNATPVDPIPAGGENAVGTDYPLNEPTGLAQDSEGNLYILDSIAGKVRVLRANGADAGKVFTLNLGAHDLTGAQDLRVVEAPGGAGPNFLYVADTNHHVVVRFALPNTLSSIATTLPPAQTAQVVMGQVGEPGFIKLGPTDVYPEIFDVSKPITEDKALLNAPTSLTFDDQGNLIVGAKGRVHLMEAAALPPGGTGNTYVIAGGVDTRNIVGDSRLGFFPETTSVRYDPITKNTLIVDFSERVVRRLWTARGAL
ncbi:MAG: hypothetical protein ACK46X_00190 [Candidatus Sericytochromatia bacterium]